MPKSEVHICECPHCQQESAHADQELHQEMNLRLSRLDEQQRRCYVEVESKRMGADGDHLLSQITGLDEKTRKLRARRTGRFSDRATSQASPSLQRGTPTRRKKDVELEPT